MDVVSGGDVFATAVRCLVDGQLYFVIAVQRFPH
jgi:hypothetical protein